MKSWRNLTKFLGIVTRRFPNLGFRYPEVAQPLGIVTLMFYNFRVMIFGNQTISGYSYLEVGFCGKTQICLILNSYESFKTEYIYKNHLGMIGKCLGL